MTKNSPRTIAVHIGSTKFNKTFDWANYQDTMDGKIVLSIGCVSQPDNKLFARYSEQEQRQIKGQLDQLHLRKIDIAHEVWLLNVTDYIGTSTLHELCYAMNLGLPIRWLEDWLIYCPQCGIEGPRSEHFLHQVLSLDEYSRLLVDENVHPYLVGQIVSWQGLLAPVVQLLSGELALQVDLCCERCQIRRAPTTYVVPGEDWSFCELVDEEGLPLADLRSADARVSLPLCEYCQHLPTRDPRLVLRYLTTRHIDAAYAPQRQLVLASELPAEFTSLLSIIAADDFERLTLRQGQWEMVVSNCDELPVPVLSAAALPSAAVAVLQL